MPESFTHFCARVVIIGQRVDSHFASFPVVEDLSDGATILLFCSDIIYRKCHQILASVSASQVDFLPTLPACTVMAI